MQPQFGQNTPSYAADGTQVAPPAGTVLAATGQLPAGFYEVYAGAGYGGTADVIDNAALFAGDRKVLTLPMIPVANSNIQFVTVKRVLIKEGDVITIQVLANGGVGSVFRGTVIATRME